MLHLTALAALATLHLAQAAAQATANNPTPFEWASQHIHMVAWPAIVWFVGRAAWTVAKTFAELKEKAIKTVGQIDTLATNHFPHMEASLMNQDKVLGEIAKSSASTASSLSILVALQGKN